MFKTKKILRSIIVVLVAIFMLGITIAASSGSNGGFTPVVSASASASSVARSNGSFVPDLPVIQRPTEGLTRESAKQAGNRISEEIMEEGIVLLKNEIAPVGEQALPMASGSNVTVFGKNSTHMVFGVGGSSGLRGGRYNTTHLHQALALEGFNINPTVRDFYMNNALSYNGRPNVPIFGPGVWEGLATGETPWRAFTRNPNVIDSFQDFSDAAIVVFSRQGGEGWDLPRRSVNSTVTGNANGGGGGWEGGFHGGRNDLRALTTHPGSGRPLESHERVDRRNDHYLRLDIHEEELLRQINMTGVFDRVIVLFNSGNQIELGFLHEDHYNEFGVDAALWIGHPGSSNGNAAAHNGISATPAQQQLERESQIERLRPIGRILSGEVNPSGRLVNTALYDITNDPTFFNFARAPLPVTGLGGEQFTGTTPISVDTFNRYLTHTESAGEANLTYVEYREGIYFDYYYYETRAFVEEEWGNPGWHRDNVVFPFGHGLSYTEFHWELLSEPSEIVLGEDMIFEVEVTNVGGLPGKDVVQLYANPPFHGGIERHHVSMVAFAKTPTIEPGDSEIVTLTVNPRDFAAFDQFGYAAGVAAARPGQYVLEMGEYNFFVSRNANSWQSCADIWSLTTSIHLSEGIAISYADTGVEYTARFAEETQFMHGTLEPTDPSGNPIALFMNEERNTQNIVMSRHDFEGTFPTRPNQASRQLTAQGVTWMNANYPGRSTVAGNIAFGTGRAGTTSLANMNTLDAGQPWEVTEMPTTNAGPQGPNGTYLTIHDMSGIPYADPLWQDFLDQWSFHDMIDFTANGGFALGRGFVGTAHGGAVDTTRFGILNNVSPDGPYGFTGHFDGNFTNGRLMLMIGRETASYPSPTVVAQTFNVDLAYRQGIVKGEEGLVHGFNGIYSPGLNAHRSPFGGRNSEYFAACKILTGHMVAGYVRGLQSRGVVPMMKHFFMNDQEIDRATGRGLITWADEQTIRLYGESWRLVVRESGVLGVMTSFARVGRVFAGGNYDVLNGLLRAEWGFNGAVVTDWWENGYMSSDLRIRAGNDLPLTGLFGGPGAPTSGPAGGGMAPASSGTAVQQSATHVAALRRSTHNVAFALANSNAVIHYASSLQQNLTIDEDVFIDLRPSLSVHVAGAGNGATQSTTAGTNGGMENFVFWDGLGTAPARSFSVQGIDNLPSGLHFCEDEIAIMGMPTSATAAPVEITVTVHNYQSRSRMQASGAQQFTLARLSTNVFTINVSAPLPCDNCNEWPCICAALSAMHTERNRINGLINALQNQTTYIGLKEAVAAVDEAIVSWNNNPQNINLTGIYNDVLEAQRARIVTLRPCDDCNVNPCICVALALMHAERDIINGLIYDLRNYDTALGLAVAIAAVELAIISWNSNPLNITLAGIHEDALDAQIDRLEEMGGTVLIEEMETERDRINILIAALAQQTTRNELSAAIAAIDADINAWNNNPLTFSLIGIDIVELEYQRARVNTLPTTGGGCGGAGSGSFVIVGFAFGLGALIPKIKKPKERK